MKFWEDLYNKYYKIWDQPKSNEDDIPINSRAFKNLSLAETIDDIQETNDKRAETNDDAKETNDDAKDTTEEVKENGDETAKEEDTANVEEEVSNEDQVTVAEEPIEIIKASDPPTDDLPKNIGVDKFVSYYDSLGDKK